MSPSNDFNFRPINIFTERNNKLDFRKQSLYQCLNELTFLRIRVSSSSPKVYRVPASSIFQFKLEFKDEFFKYQPKHFQYFKCHQIQVCLKYKSSSRVFEFRVARSSTLVHMINFHLLCFALQTMCSSQDMPRWNEGASTKYASIYKFQCNNPWN